MDATITTGHSEGRTFGCRLKTDLWAHPSLDCLDRPDTSADEALAALLRPGNAGSNTAAHHITMLTEALASLFAA